MRRMHSVLIAGLVFAKGAAQMKGVAGVYDAAHAKAMGANSVRTFDEAQLEAVACSAGLDVFATVPVDPGDGHEIAGRKAVEFVNKWKSKDCIKMWGIGNELDQRGDPNAMMKLVAAVHGAIRTADARKTSTCLAGYDRLAAYLNVRPTDALCVNCYGCASNACQKLNQLGYKGDFILGEYGGQGWWEVPKVEGVPGEPSSTEKSVQTAAGYEGGVSQCAGTGVKSIGSFAFVSERKIEGSATWFGLWAETPSKSSYMPVADRWAVLKAIWSGSPSSPEDVRQSLKDQGIAVVQSMTVGPSNGRVGPGGNIGAALTIADPAVATKYRLHWDVRSDITPASGASGATMNTPEPTVHGTGTVEANEGNLRSGSGVYNINTRAPAAKGVYRLTAYLVPKEGSDGQGVVTASVPLIVG